MKKYYANFIVANANYRRNMRNIKLKHKLLIESSVEVAQKLGIPLFWESMPFFIIAVAFPSDLKKILAKAIELMPNENELFVALVQKSAKIELVTSRFSLKALEDFIAFPEVSILVKHYLSQIENRKYTRHYKSLQDLSGNVLSSQSKVERGGTANEAIRGEVRALNLIVSNSLF